MAGIYSRLFPYRESADRKPLEDFLTEAFADLFDRLAPLEKYAILRLLLSRNEAERLSTIIPDFTELRLLTQVTIGETGKRPDMVLSAGTRNLAVIEAKVGARFQQHQDIALPEQETEAVIRHQLETYANWIGSENLKPDDWPGAVVLLTAWTDPPADFNLCRSDRVVTGVKRWKQIGDWLTEASAEAGPDSVQGTLASDLRLFIEEHGLMTKYATSRDLATAMLFAPSFAALYAMFDDTIKAVAEHVPKISAGRRLKVEFWQDYNVFWGWFNFSRSIRRRPTLPYLAVGICFEICEGWEKDILKLPQDEPFFFMICGDGNQRENIDGILKGIPEGWVSIEENWSIISCRAVSSFASNPDKRVEELQAWAKSEAENLTAIIPNYEEAPAGPIASETTTDEE